MINKMYPRVTIVGRSNVGKSALFNKLANDKRALVYDEEGVTRDPLVDLSSWCDFTYQVIDTAGFLPTLKKQKNDIVAKSILHGEEYIQTSDMILFVVDGTVGYTQEDLKLFSYVKKISIPICIVINKIDTKLGEEEYLQMVGTLQEGNTIGISAIHSKGISDLQDLIIKNIDWSKYVGKIENDNEYFKVVLLGRPNVGKSSIMNVLMEEDISIVSDVAGTTREAISKDIITEDNFKITLSDTAGVRKSRSIEERIEELMVSNTMKTIDKSHIVIMVLDISSQDLYDQDINLVMRAFYDLHKAVLIIWNKVDLLKKNEDPFKIIKEKTEKYSHFFDIVPQIIFSAITKRNKEMVIPAIKKLWHRYKQRFEGKEIYTIVNEAFLKTPLVKIKQKLQIQSIHVLKTCPPTFCIKSRQHKLFGPSEITFLSNKVRKKFDLSGVPIVWKFAE